MVEFDNLLRHGFHNRMKRTDFLRSGKTGLGEFRLSHAPYIISYQSELLGVCLIEAIELPDGDEAVILLFLIFR